MIGFILYTVSLISLLIAITFHPCLSIGLIFFLWIAYKE